MIWSKIFGFLRIVFSNKGVVIGVVGFVLLFSMVYAGQGRLKKVIVKMIDSRIEEIDKKYKAVVEKLNEEIKIKEKRLVELEKRNNELLRKIEKLEREKKRVGEVVSGMPLNEVIEEFRKLGYDVKLREEVCK